MSVPVAPGSGVAVPTMPGAVLMMTAVVVRDVPLAVSVTAE
ncbi:hypothetical protein [Halovenus salina]|uniref:Uncharacterized protein n=1 Tax=Halovenus salina TaxID=1510225 RepID=A0ABD5W4D7_9EURY